MRKLTTYLLRIIFSPTLQCCGLGLNCSNRNELQSRYYFCVIISHFREMADIEKSMDNLQVQDDVSNILMFSFQENIVLLGFL